MVTCQQGGDACKGLNMWDFQTFAGKEHLHGLKYQDAVMPDSPGVAQGTLERDNALSRFPLH